MNEKRQHEEVQSRNESFAEKQSCKFWQEIPSAQHPYIAQGARCQGYDIFELAQKRSFVDVFFLLFRGDLPSASESQLLEALMIMMINPGPRHEATRAAINAGIGKTETTHILPIAAATFGGKFRAAGLVEASMRFLRKARKKSPTEVAENIIQEFNSTEANVDSLSDYLDDAAPGFGSIYGGVDEFTENAALKLIEISADSESLSWGQEFSEHLKNYHCGWMNYGLVAAVLSDLSFQPRNGPAIFQFIAAPGLIAHGLEYANKPITAMPFVKDEDYVIER